MEGAQNSELQASTRMLPPNLYIQLDNLAKDNRNWAMMTRKAAESKREEIKKRAFEEADSIREPARGDVTGACGASTMTSSHEAQTNSIVVGRNDADEASSILRFAQAFATEGKYETRTGSKQKTKEVLGNSKLAG
ncbi:hypothetical protein R1sor_011305 [Riccia sorocarpa]|uniref:Uncharacterized protein n=1 Tax=Riccia sorocarpa TaxID=122646 RepID=A0ABD3I3Y7_9MARC